MKPVLGCLIAGWLVLGCRPDTVTVKPKPTVQPDIPAEERVLKTSNGWATRRAKNKERDVLWFVKWADAKFDYAGDQDAIGRMTGVSGRFFQKNQTASEFEAPNAVADRTTNRLWLSGGIRLVSKSPMVVLKCQKLEWDADAGTIRAEGTVTVNGKTFELGPFDKILATPSLDTIGTPDLFAKRPTKETP